MKIWLTRILLGLAVLFLVLGVSGFALIRFLNYWPKPVEKANLVCKADAPSFPKDKKELRILSWNVQFSASRKYHFFYDNGKDVLASKADVEATLKEIIRVAKETKPDIILWQEFDINSKRSAYVNQLEGAWKALPFGCRADTPYFLSGFVPAPSFGNAMGKVDMRLAVFSKYKMKNPMRYALPALTKDSFLRKAFNLKRAVMTVDMPLDDKRTLRLLNTHLSAFDFGDGTKTKQVNQMIKLIDKAEKENMLWIAGGDFNLLPPGVTAKSLKIERELYAYKKNPVELLFAKYKSALEPAEYKKDPKKYNTYLPFGAKQTDRWIDYVFVSKSIKVKSYQVNQKENNISDHLPIIIDLQLP